ncbi:MAG TPA: DMT family transporter [Patescibacteria group bacterium]|nr:DMT family transporter [Patescibacteria group bacterium]
MIVLDQLKKNLLNRYSVAPLVIFFAALLWATDTPFRDYLIKHQKLTSLTIVTWEHMIDVVFCLPILFWVRNELRSLKPKQWCGLLLVGAGSSALATLAFTESFKYVSPSVALLLQKLQPFFAVTFAWLFLHERFTRKFWVYAGLAVLAAYVITFAGFTPKLYEGDVLRATFYGTFLAIVACLLWGAGTVVGKRLLKDISFAKVTILRFGFGFLLLFIWNSVAGTTEELFRVTPTDLGYLLLMSIISGLVALFSYYWALRFTRASIATFAELGYPLAAVLLNWWLLQYSLNWYQIGGAGVLLLSVFMLTKENRTSNIPVTH